MKQQLAAARMTAVKKWPQATAAVLSLVPVEVPGLGTACVDQYWRLYYDPAFLGSQKPDIVAGIILHEVSHLLLAHHARAKGLIDLENEAERKLWNVATDLAINANLKRERIPLPEGVVYPTDFKLPDNLAAESYLVELRKQQKEQQDVRRRTERTGGPESLEHGVHGNGDWNSELQPPERSSRDEKRSISGGTADIPAPCDPQAPGTSGSCADGKRRPWEAPPPSGDPIQDEAQGVPPGIPQHEAKQIARQVAEAMKAQGRGKGSAWEGFIRDILEPRIDPRTLLMREVSRAVEAVVSGSDEWTYRRPSRRPGHGGLLRPSGVQIVPRITVLVDSSGSMGRDDLQLALGLIAKVLNGLRLRDGIHVIVGDDGVQSAGKVFDPRKLAIQGRGGTDMAGLIEHAADQKQKPDVIVVATDGYTGWPRKPVGPKVVACLTRKDAASKVPSWIKTVLLHP